MLSESKIETKENESVSPEQAIHALAREVAAALGDGWSYKLPKVLWGDRLPRWAEVVHADGYSISLAPVWNKPGRIVAHGNWPRTADGQVSQPYGATMPEITVAESRGVETLVKEIKRRLLPEFIELWKKAADQARKNDEFETGRRALLERLAKIAGKTEQDIRQERYIHLYIGGHSIDIEVGSPKGSRLVLDLPPDGAARVLAVALEEAKKSEGAE